MSCFLDDWVLGRTATFMSRLCPAHRGMQNNTKYRTTRHECRVTLGTISYRDIYVASLPGALEHAE